MKKLLALFVSLFAVAACNREPNITAAQLPDATAEVVYEDNEPDDDAQARLAASPNQSIVFPRVTNDQTFAQAYNVKFWFFGATEPAQATRFDRAAIDALPAAQRDKPKVATKTNLRLYASKSLSPGWYMAKGSGSEVIYKFQVIKGKPGRLQIDDENNPQDFTGYTDNHGKLKVSMWNKGGQQVTEANVYFGPTYFDEDLQRFMARSPFIHIFSRDGNGASKYMTWCLPTGTYQVAYRKANNQRTSAQAVVTAGKTVHIKLVF